MAIKWNQEQQAILLSQGENIMVSASAGSGKTAVMLERIMKLCEKVEVERLAVLAYNDDIAVEIKDKLSKRLAEAAEQIGGEFWLKQIDNLPFCDICTFHKFCAKLVRENFEIAQVDVSFSIMDEKEQAAVYNKAMREVLDDYYESSDADFLWLKQRFGGKREDALTAAIKQIYTFAASQMDREQWLEKVALKPYQNNDNFIIDTVIKDKRQKAEKLLQEGERLTEELRKIFKQAQLTADNASGKSKVKSAGKNLNYFEELTLFYKAFLQQYAAADSFDNLKIDTNAIPPYDRRNIRVFEQSVNEAVGVYITQAKELFDEAKSYVHFDLAELNHQGAKIVGMLLDLNAKVSRRFSALKREDNKLDFDDLEHFALKVLKNDRAKDAIKSKYDYVYVDEYQDTNRVQEFIIESISQKNNLFTVGDSKQSIYRFRLSEPKILLERRALYKSAGIGKAFALNYNYRSDVRILDFANDVFSALMTEDFGGENYSLEAKFKAGKNFKVVNCLPAVEVASYVRKSQVETSDGGVYSVRNHQDPYCECNEAFTEAKYVAEKIMQIVGGDIYDADLECSRTASYGDIAILAAKRSAKVANILRYLKQFGIPVEAEPLSKKEQCFETDIVIDLLRVIDNFKQDIPLSAVLKVFGGFDDNELLKIRNAFSGEKFFYRCVEQYANSGSDDKLCQKCSVFFDRIDKWRKVSNFCGVSALLEIILDETDYLLKLRSEEGGDGKLARLLQYIASLKDKSYASSISEYLYACDSLNIENELNAPLSTDKECVKTSTIHHSKGLEFPVVFVIDASASNSGNPNSLYADAELGIAVKYYDAHTRKILKTPQSTFISQKNNRATLEEKLRLMYVGLTRAKNHLFVVGSSLKKDKTEGVDNTKSFMEWLRLAKEIMPSLANSFIEIEAEAEEQQPKQECYCFKTPTDEYLAAAEKYISFKYPYQESTKISIKHTVTEINKQDERVDVYLPHVFSESTAERGSVYHKILEKIDYCSKSHEQIQEQIQQLVEGGIIDSEVAKEISISMVAECLNSPLIKHAEKNKHLREASFMLYLPACEVMQNGIKDKILIQGTLDLLIFDGQHSGTVVDFKSSALAPEAIKQLYAKQLSIYKKAAQICYGLKEVKSCIYILGQNKVVEMD